MKQRLPSPAREHTQNLHIPSLQKETPLKPGIQPWAFFLASDVFSLYLCFWLPKKKKNCDLSSLLVLVFNGDHVFCNVLIHLIDRAFSLALLENSSVWEGWMTWCGVLSTWSGQTGPRSKGRRTMKGTLRGRQGRGDFRDKESDPAWSQLRLL